MTELERQLTAALERLSEQSERERQRHAEQIEALTQRIERQDAESETLRRQFGRLDGQLIGLAQDYETLAAALRELWR